MTVGAQPSGYVADTTDCDDGDITIYPVHQPGRIDSDRSGVPDDDPALYGMDFDCAALSCEEIHLDNPTYTDGVIDLSVTETVLCSLL